MTLEPGTIPDNPDDFTEELKAILILTNMLEDSNAQLLDKLDELIEAVHGITER